LSKSSMEKIPIPLSSIAEQARIVKKVKLIYQLIDELAEKYRSEQEERQKLVVSSMARLAKGQSSLELDKITEIIKTKADVAEFRKTILRLAISGQLVPQDPSEGTGQELYQQIQIEKQKSIIEGKLKKQKSLPQINGDEIPFGIPKSWKWARLADITVFSIGRTPSRRESLYWEEGSIPWVSIADLRAGLHIDTTKELISKKAFEKCFNGRIVPLGSLLYSFKLTIGKMSIIDMDSVHNEAIASFNTFSPVMTGYLFKALEVIDPTRRSNGAVMGKTLNSASLSLLEIPLPPLAEQTRIIQKTTQLLDLVSRLENYTER
jgi:type I restriction enzyme S subunit